MTGETIRQMFAAMQSNPKRSAQTIIGFFDTMNEDSYD